MHDRSPASASREGGYILVAVMFLTLILGGLSIGLIGEGMASRVSVVNHETSARALAAAETGLVRAEMEVRALVDHGTDGIGTVSGVVDQGRFSVTAIDDPISPSRWILRATGEQGHSRRRVEVGIRRRVDGRFVDALFAEEDLVLGGGSPTDAYDSRLGTYASQAVNVDAVGTYAQMGGNIGSNRNIELNGSGVRVRGDAVPGPLHQTILSGGATVTGDRAPRTFDVTYEPESYDAFHDAFESNDNNRISGALGGTASRYHAGRMTLSLTGGADVTLPGGTYFFSEISLKGNSRLAFSGPATIYLTGGIDFGAGAILDAARPSDVIINAHPYPLPPSNAPTETRIKVNSGSHVTWALQGPQATLEIGGGNHFYGAAAVRSVDISGGNYFHYDKALGHSFVEDVARMERIYWREIAPPPR